ncbi:hypothetical protein Golomagni_04941 [Golovinomyces magnicellulatus]|nr:hypothetical protein Golomagni_04941 [Golovinomyces magnicellulatus]
MKEITSLLEFEKLKSSRLLIIDFTAAWCGPCRVISPVFDRAATDFESSEIIFAKCDVDNNADVSQACEKEKK